MRTKCIHPKYRCNISNPESTRSSHFKYVVWNEEPSFLFHFAAWIYAFVHLVLWTWALQRRHFLVTFWALLFLRQSTTSLLLCGPTIVRSKIGFRHLISVYTMRMSQTFKRGIYVHMKHKGWSFLGTHACMYACLVMLSASHGSSEMGRHVEN